MNTLGFTWLLSGTLLFSACASGLLKGRDDRSGQSRPDGFKVYIENKLKIDSLLTCAFKNDSEKVFLPFIRNEQGVTYLYLFLAQGLKSDTVLIDFNNREKVNPSFAGPGMKIGFEGGKLSNVVGNCGDLPCLDSFIGRVASCNGRDQGN